MGRHRWNVPEDNTFRFVKIFKVIAYDREEANKVIDFFEKKQRVDQRRPPLEISIPMNNNDPPFSIFAPPSMVESTASSTQNRGTTNEDFSFLKRTRRQKQLLLQSPRPLRTGSPRSSRV